MIRRALFTILICAFHWAAIAPGPAAAQSSPPGAVASPAPFPTARQKPASEQPAATTAANSEAAARFRQQVDGALAARGIGGFWQPDQLAPPGGSLAYNPLQLHLGRPFGPIYGTAELFLGIASNKMSSNNGFNNLELLSEINLSNHLRGHIQTNLINLPIKNAERRVVELPELYGEYYTDGILGGATNPGERNTYHLSLRVGKMGQLQYPFIDPLTMLDRTPGDFYSYQGVVAMGELDQPGGGGVHLSLYDRIGSSGGKGTQGIADAYLVFRHQTPTHLYYESRLGWVPRVQLNQPASAGLGIQQYLGYQSGNYGIGFFYGDIFRQSNTIGVSIRLARSGASEFFGLAPSHPLSVPDGIALEAPVAQLYLFSGGKAVPGEPLVGQSNSIRTWNTGSGVGVGTTDDLPAGAWGLNGGRNIRRVERITPWWLYNASFEQFPFAAGRRTKTENELHFRSDAQYNYYRVIPRSHFALDLTAEAADTHKPLAQAIVTVTGPTGEAKTLKTSRRGRATYRFQLLSSAAASVHVAVKATGYEPASQDITLQPNTPNHVVIELKPLTGTVSGTVIDAETRQVIPDTEVILTPATGTATVKTTGADGGYQFTDLTPGVYLLKAHRPGYIDVDHKIDITGGGSETVSFALPPEKGGIVGHVVDAAGNSIAGAIVTVVNAAGTTIATLTSGADGAFAERLAPGAYTLQTVAAGYENTNTTVTVPAGQLANVTVTMRKSTP